MAMIDRCKFIHNLTCEQASRRLGELESENASLRGAAQGLGELCDKYKAENTKLRELVRGVWDAALHPETFGDGSYLLKRMRELGIEVE